MTSRSERRAEHGSVERADLVGVGFGPAGVALAAALDDDAECHPQRPRRHAVFLDRASSSAWHPAMLLPGTDIQHHFLRDLATPRNPRSRFTFANYLYQQGRLFPFCLLGSWVGRAEWSDYLQWAAVQVAAEVRYQSSVEEIRPQLKAGTIVGAEVLGRTTEGRSFRILASDVVVSTGQLPYVPEPLRPALGEQVVHASQYLPRVTSLASDAQIHAVVVGAGQNAGEILLDLLGRLARCRVTSICRNAGFRLYDLGQFSNEIYFPEETDYVYRLDRAAREEVFRQARATNYACVDPDVGAALYRAAYEDRVTGGGRISVRKRTEVVGLDVPDHGPVRVHIREVNTGEVSELCADLVILCTGFIEPRVPPVLEPFQPYLARDEHGDPVVTRDYRLEVPASRVGVYLNGLTEWRHGISNATSFSMMALKAESIVQSLNCR